MKHQGYSNYVSDVRPPRGLATLMVMDVNDLAYKYRYNSQEYQDELGLNVTAMDFRQYDSAIGRFYGMDRLSELGYSITPYRFAYNNPVYWSDPTGLFETRKEARAYRKEHGIEGKIKKEKDGSYTIYEKSGATYNAASALDAEQLGVNQGDVVRGVVITESKSKEDNSNASGKDPLDLTIWGDNKSGEYNKGRKGSYSNSVEASDFIAPKQSGNLLKNLNILKWLLYFFSNSATTVEHATALQQAIQEDSSTSTMDIQNVEPVTPPDESIEVIVSESIEVVSFEFNVNDSTVTKSSKRLNFRGKGSVVKKQLDSIKKINKNREEDKNAWLKDWNK